MNFLAHIYLSGEDDPLLKLGNFMGDTVRGKQYLDYPPTVQKGILLHRQIDTFTDNHPLFRSSKKRLVPQYGHYAGVITDIFYDYFLAKHWERFSKTSFENYVLDFYTLIQEKNEVLNPQMRTIASQMIADNWLQSYETISGMEVVFYHMDKRTGFRSRMQYATAELRDDELLFEEEFFPFFEQIQDFVLKFRNEEFKG